MKKHITLLFLLIFSNSLVSNEELTKEKIEKLELLFTKIFGSNNNKLIICQNDKMYVIKNSSKPSELKIEDKKNETKLQKLRTIIYVFFKCIFDCIEDINKEFNKIWNPLDLDIPLLLNPLFPMNIFRK